MDSDDHGQTDDEKKISIACSSCHRRKLKCDRMPVCSNCRRADIPCVYTPHNSKSGNAPTTRDARRKPRGPYQKGRTVREKELEHIVEILQEKCTLLEAQVHSPDHQTSPEGSRGSGSRYKLAAETIPAPMEGRSRQRTQPFPQLSDLGTHDGILLSSAHTLDLWLIYTSRFDPINKVLHCPSFSTELLDALRNPKGMNAETKARIYSVYLAALNTLESEEVLSRFGTPKDILTSFYATELTNLLTDAEGCDRMTFGMLQALVIYMIPLRRQPGPGASAESLCSRALRSARLLGMDEPTTYEILSPLEAELRRRTWWNICRHESAYAEEIHTRNKSIMHSTDIPLPLNLEDHDLNVEMTQSPVPRAGITTMSFVLTMMVVVRSVGRISSLLKLNPSSVEADLNERWKSLKENSMLIVQETRTRIEVETLQYCNASRPFDWFILIVAKVILTKVEVMVLECPPETDVIAFNTFHDIKVGLSLDVIECHQLLLKEERLKPWRWSYRDTQQWYATIYVLEEVARRPDAPFASRVWQVIDVVFADMELLNKHGMKPEDRSKLLNAHERAIEAKGALLRCLDAAIRTSTLPITAAEGSIGNNAAGLNAMHDCPSMTRSDPWQMDQSLFDVQEAELANLDDFFWPST